MDAISWFILVLHQAIGHEKTAAVLGVPAWPAGPVCLICESERNPTIENKRAVIQALGGM